MRIQPHQAKVGDDILWKGSGLIYHLLSPILWLCDLESHFDMWGWHTGYIVKIRFNGEVVTSQAIASGVQEVTYPNLNKMGKCRIYRWLKNVDEEKLQAYSKAHIGTPYDPYVYFWTILGAIFKLRICDRKLMCWENVSEKNRYMGRELQPEDEPCLLSRMVRRWEDD